MRCGAVRCGEARRGEARRGGAGRRADGAIAPAGRPKPRRAATRETRLEGDRAGERAGEEKTQDAGAMAYDEKVARASARR